MKRWPGQTTTIWDTLRFHQRWVITLMKSSNLQLRNVIEDSNMKNLYNLHLNKNSNSFIQKKFIKIVGERLRNSLFGYLLEEIYPKVELN